MPGGARPAAAGRSGTFVPKPRLTRVDKAQLAVGDGVWYKQTAGVIRFVGETRFGEGEWIGVELDTCSGKNDGSKKGVTYFQCEPNHGLFVRRSALVERKPGSEAAGQAAIDKSVLARSPGRIHARTGRRHKNAAPLAGGSREATGKRADSLARDAAAQEAGAAAVGEEEVHARAALFRLVGVDKSGCISREEWERAFDLLDGNKDGCISRKEWHLRQGTTRLFDSIERASIPMVTRQEWHKAFDAFDRNHDGRITMQEWCRNGAEKVANGCNVEQNHGDIIVSALMAKDLEYASYTLDKGYLKFSTSYFCGYGWVSKSYLSHSQVKDFKLTTDGQFEIDFGRGSLGGYRKLTLTGKIIDGKIIDGRFLQ